MRNGNDSIPITVEFSNAVQKPITVPVTPSLSRATPYFDGGMWGKAPDSSDYQPHSEGSFIKKNGSSEGKYVITTGVWKMSVGDKPIVSISLRDTNSAYAKPAILPYLGVEGKFRLEVAVDNTTKYLDEFSNITTILKAGQPEWACEDRKLGIKIVLTAHAFLEDYGCALIAKVESLSPKQVQLNWHFTNADFVKDSSGFSKFRYGKYTEIFVGSTNKKSAYQNGLTKSVLKTGEKSINDTLICIWGYKDYDHQAVDDAFKRLRFRPFPSEKWVDLMKKNWFNHWIERGLDPEKKFIAVKKNAVTPINLSKQFWVAMCNKVRVKTGDDRFDNIVQSLGSRLISNYEYPSYMHGTNYMKYGKINCGLYGHEAAGFHDKVASSLRFISGTQDIKGRIRYFEPVFTISTWAEEMNPYFIDQVWYHYRWTGDKEFLIEMWPSVRKALEHFITTSNPAHDGYFTGYYENWNGDGKSRGGTGALWTAMAIKALSAGFEMAKLLDDVDWEKGTFQVTDYKNQDGDYNKRYLKLLEKAEAVYEKRYNKMIGAYSSGDWNAELRNNPGNEESNYAIWREIGDPLKNYTSMRYIREQYHQTAPNGVIEFSNKDWPVCWSNHYDSYAEAMSSIASAAMCNDMNNYWPILKTAAEKIYTVPECTAIAGGRSIMSLESDQMFMMAVLDNVFGIKPYFNKNLLIIRPSFPEEWKNPSIDLPDLSYQYLKGKDEITLIVKTPVKRQLQAEIPVKQAIRRILVNGREEQFEIKKEVNYCRVIVKSKEAITQTIKLELYPDVVSIAGATNLIVNHKDSIRIGHGQIVDIFSPQEKFANASVSKEIIEIDPIKSGSYTLFAELRNGNISWYQPLELKIKEPWTINEEYRAWEQDDNTSISKAAKLLSPDIAVDERILRFRLTNNRDSLISRNMDIVICGHHINQPVTIQAGETKNFELSLAEICKEMSPGTILFTVNLGNESKSSHVINWQIPQDINKSIPVDLKKYYNISLSELYGTEFFKWRIDYTGAAVGVDWRDTLLIDKLGYKLFSPPTSLISYGVLPEQMSPAWWSVPSIPDSLHYPVSFSFLENAPDKKNVIALVDAENNRDVPSQAIIKFPKPVSAEKIYMLTANLTKTSKSYYPAVEIEINYSDGEKKVTQLIPPYNMPSLVQAFCPDAFPIPLGKIEKQQTMDSDSPGLSVTDLVTDPKRSIKDIVFRCVASETSFGLIALSILPASGQ